MSAVTACPVIAFHGTADPFDPYSGGDSMLGPVIGVEAWATDWAGRNGCLSGLVAHPAIGDVVPLAWAGCAAPVQLYRVNDGGHTWPGQPTTPDDWGYVTMQISANDLIWAFFGAHPLP